MKRITSLFCLIGLVLTMYAIPVFAAPDTNACIKVTATYQKYSGGLSFAGYNINGYDAYNYKFIAGDKFEYEVYLETEAVGLGYIDIQASKLKSVDADGLELHDWKQLRATGVKDSEEIDCHPANDLIEVAYKKWYKRSIAIPKSFEGYMTRHIYPMAYKAVASTPVLPTAPEVFYIRNVRVVGEDGSVRLVIFSENERFISSTKVEGSGAKLVLTGENQKAVTKAPTAAVSKPGTTTSNATSTITSSGVVSTPQTTSETVSSDSKVAYSMPQGTDSIVSSESANSSSSNEKDSSNTIIIILSAVIILLIAAGIVGFLFLKKKIAR